jgi:hypothetical protein
MKKAPEGALRTTNCPHSEANKPLNRGNTCPRWDSNQPLPLKIRHSPKNIPNPAQSDAGTTESEAPGVDTVHTLFSEHLATTSHRRVTVLSVLEYLYTPTAATPPAVTTFPDTAGIKRTKWAEQ